MKGTPNADRGWVAFLGVGRTCALVLLVTLCGQLGASLEAFSIDRAVTVARGLSVLWLVVMAGYALAFTVPSKLPDIFWVSLVATLAGLPVTPGSDRFIAVIGELSFVAMITPVLAFVALGLTAREVALFRRTGAQIVVISLLVFTGTFLGSAAVAQAVLTTTG